jgi:hypothetical protein
VDHNNLNNNWAKIEENAGAVSVSEGCRWSGGRRHAQRAAALRDRPQSALLSKKWRSAIGLAANLLAGQWGTPS